MKRSPRIGSSTLSNLFGYIGLTIVALACTPFYIKALGEARFGIVSLIWLLFGYFGVFDLGMSRATANALAREQNSDPKRRSTIFWSALLSNLAFGAIGGLVFYLIGRTLLVHYTNISAELAQEVDASILWVALLIPLSTVNGVLAASLEATERFFQLNMLQLAGSTIFQTVPLLAILLLAPRIDIAVAASALGRAISVCLVGIAALRIVGTSHLFHFEVKTVRNLVRYGGWVAVTAVLGPVITTLDQFLIGALIGAHAVAYYSVAYSVAGRANMIPISLSRALFPRLSQQDHGQARATVFRSVKLLANSTAGLYCAAILVCPLLFRLWLGREFGSNAAPIAEILIVGVWINGLAYIPFTMSQAQGRPDRVAKIALFEFGPYLALVYVATTTMGLTGAALAWSLRALADTLIQLRFAGFHSVEIMKVLLGLPLLITFCIVSRYVPMGDIAALAAATMMGAVSLVTAIKDPLLQQYFPRLRKFSPTNVERAAD